MKIRVISPGLVSPLYSQAIYHGIAEAMHLGDDPVLVILQPDSSYISIGLHQSFEEEINTDYCSKNHLPVIRRHIGGGTVLLDDNQLFFQFIFPKNKAPKEPKNLYPTLLLPVLQTFHHFGMPASTKGLNDICINEKKIGGTGAASINDATVLVGSFMFEFDHERMCSSVNVTSENFRATLLGLMEKTITTINQQLRMPPTKDALIQIFLQKVSSILEYEIVEDTLRDNESHAIAVAEKQLSNADWLNEDGRKLIKNGLKIAAHTYLVEKASTFKDQQLTVRLLIQQQKITQMWLEGENTAIQASLLLITNYFNQHSTSLTEQEIIEALKKATNNLDSICYDDILTLCHYILELCQFSEY